MAGHSQFKNIMHRKGAQDAKRAKIFTKIIRELTVAAKSGMPDPDSNPRLRAAIIMAREANMPKDNVDRAIKRATGGEEGADYQEVRYEGYGPGGVAVIVDGLTDNRNRTAADVRSAFNKFGGSLGEAGSVSFMFDRLGVIKYPDSMNFDTVFEAALEAGAENVETNDGSHEVLCAFDDFSSVRDALMKALGDPTSAKIEWRPKSGHPVEDSTAETLFKFLDILEDNDDVQTVTCNFEVSEAFLEKMNG